MVKDHSDSKRKPTAATIWAIFLLAAKDFLNDHPTDMLVYSMDFVTPVVEHWLEQEIAQ